MIAFILRIMMNPFSHSGTTVYLRATYISNQPNHHCRSVNQKLKPPKALWSEAAGVPMAPVLRTMGGGALGCGGRSRSLRQSQSHEVSAYSTSTQLATTRLLQKNVGINP